MNSILNLLKTNNKLFDEKSLHQILAFSGNGKLSDDSTTSTELRELLDEIPSNTLKKYTDECLNKGFDESGFALQDIISQIGKRLGFEVENGLYKGKKNEIGFDGIWTNKDDYKILVEVKTTDAYRINLDIIANYRNKLIQSNKFTKETSSILIVVGRQDTGDLEAQIRGSKHAWDIRLISTDSLLKLLDLKENLNDTKTLQQINEILKPFEYTRIDKLIETIFLTSKDLILDETENDIEEEITEIKESASIRNAPSTFHQECIIKIQEKMNLNLIKQSKSSYENKEKNIGLTCSISKEYNEKNNLKYWFAFHPHQEEFLKNYKTGYVVFGCGSKEKIIVFPFKDFLRLKENFWTTEKEDRHYWHVVIILKENKYFIAQLGDEKYKEITKFLL